MLMLIMLMQANTMAASQNLSEFYGAWFAIRPAILGKVLRCESALCLPLRMIRQTGFVGTKNAIQSKTKRHMSKVLKQKQCATESEDVLRQENLSGRFKPPESAPDDKAITLVAKRWYYNVCVSNCTNYPIRFS